MQLADSPSLLGLFNEVVAKMHTEQPRLKQMLKSKPWQNMMRETGRQLTQAAEEGYGQKLAGLADGSPDAQMLEKFADNLYIFSAQKDYKLLEQLNGLLTTEAGTIRPYADFQKQALALHEDYNVTWLQAEYQTAVATAQMARKWQGFQEGNTSKYFLKYSTVGDSRVRPEHMERNGITLPVDDLWWNLNTPPLGFNCRCTIVRVPRAGRTATTQSDLDGLASPAPGFGHNAAKIGVIFPEGHQYSNIPKDIMPLLQKLGIQGRLASGYQRAHTDKASGGTVDVHQKHGAKEAQDNLVISKMLATKGERVKLLPNPDEVSADATRNGVKWEFKTLENYQNLEGRVSKEVTSGRKQSGNLLIRIKGPYDPDQVAEGMNRAVRNNSDSDKHLIENVAILHDDTLRQFTREQIKRRDFGSLPRREK